jgi:hypothetical protein
MIRFFSHKTASPTMVFKRKNLLYFTAAAALSSSSQAWVITPTVHLQRRHMLTSIPTAASLSLVTRRELFSAKQENRATRMHFSSQKNNEEKKGLLSKAGSAVKSVLPTKWFGTKEEKQELQRRKEVRDEISGGLNEILKDAPLPVKMIAKLVAPLMSGIASTLAATMADQKRTTEALLEDARGYLMGDPAVTSALGEPISVGNPFSQSSSTTSINGKIQSRMEMAMPVSGSRGSGVARILATQEGISQLQVEVGGSSINVSLKKQGLSSSGRGSSYSSPRDDDNIIEAEIIDKETK